MSRKVFFAQRLKSQIATAISQFKKEERDTELAESDV